jgi:uncharacterized protein
MSAAISTDPEAFEIPCRDGLSIRGDVYRAQSPRGAVIICHGFKGFARWAFFPYLARAVAKEGLNAITFDFSGSGIGPDRESFTQLEAFADNTFSRELDDLDLIVDYMRRRNVIGKKFGLMGHSRGGGTAILFTAPSDSDVNALVTWASISYANRWLPEDVKTWRTRGYAEVVNSRTGQVLKLGTHLLEEVEAHGKTKLNIEAAAAKIKVPWLIVHGTADDTVPSAEAERLNALSPGVSTLMLVKEANHGFDARHPLTEVPPALDKVVKATVKFFAEHATIA